MVKRNCSSLKIELKIQFQYTWQDVVFSLMRELVFGQGENHHAYNIKHVAEPLYAI